MFKLRTLTRSLSDTHPLTTGYSPTRYQTLTRPLPGCLNIHPPGSRKFGHCLNSEDSGLPIEATGLPIEAICPAGQIASMYRQISSMGRQGPSIPGQLSSKERPISSKQRHTSPIERQLSLKRRPTSSMGRQQNQMKNKSPN